MPPRIISFIIVAAWLSAISWLGYREWWPYWRADSPPPFTVELADEATPLIAHWSIWRGERKIGMAQTRMSVQRDDTVLLHSTIDNLDLTIVKVPRLATVQRVTREGQLLSITSTLQLLLTLDRTYEIKAGLEGTVRDGNLYAHSRVESPDFGKAEQDLDPITLASGSMLNPMQPVAHIKVYPGQHWTITNVDPLAEVFNASLKQFKLGSKLLASPPRKLIAEVSDKPQPLMFHDISIPCHLVSYRSDDLTGRTWVQESNGKVLRQEVKARGETLILQRED